MSVFSNLDWTIVIVYLVALIYTSMGGTTAVIWTDVFQSFVLFAGAFIILYGLIDYLPNSLGETMAELKSIGKLQALDFSAGFDKVTGAWAGIVGMALYHTTVYGSNQMMVQRTLASKNIGDAKKSYLMMGFFAPAILYSKSGGSILEVLSKVGSFFVGAQLGMYALGFFSKHATEKGLLFGTAFGFAVVIYVGLQTDIAWPWYCLIGASSNFVVSTIASILIDGWQKDWSPYTIKGQLDKFRNEGLEEKDNGWYLVPGKVDKVSYILLAYFALVIGFLAALEHMF